MTPRLPHQARHKAACDAGRPAPSITVISSTMFFKDADHMYTRLAATGKSQLIGECGALQINPISAADLAARIADAVLNEAEYGARVTVGGPETLTFSAMMKLMGDAAGWGGELRMQAVPVWLGYAARGLAGWLAWATGSGTVRRIHRIIHWLVDMSTHGGPGGLVGTPYGKDPVHNYIEQLPARFGKRPAPKAV